MSSTRQERVDVVDIHRHGEKLILPKDMSLMQGIKVLKRQMEYEEEVVAINEEIDAFPWDGAIAFQKALERRFGWATAEPTPSFFGPQPPNLISVEIGYRKTQNVIWGRFSMPGVEDGFLNTSTAWKADRRIFKIGGEVKRKYEGLIREIADDTRRIVLEESIYRGKAFRLRFRDENGEPLPMPTPVFMDTSGIKPHELILPTETREAVEDSIFSPIQHRERARRHGVPGKRGILLCGPYGCGKTMIAYVTAKLSTDEGMTYIYLERVGELQDALRFAAQYGPTVIFGEDIDRAVTGERSVEMDDILNTIDGVESKSAEVMVVLTTNHVEKINQAMLRPGRLDAVILIPPPDNEAAEGLVRQYGRGLVEGDEDLTDVGRALEGKIPAVIREVVERAKLRAIYRSDSDNFTITATDLLRSAGTMRMQLELLAEKPEDVRSDLEKLGVIVGGYIQAGISSAARRGIDVGEITRVLEATEPEREPAEA